MPKKSRKGGQQAARQDTHFAIGAISIWLVVMMVAGGMLLIAATGWADLLVLQPLPLVPTVLPMPPAPTREEAQTVVQAEPDTSETLQQNTAPTEAPLDSPTRESKGVVFEATFTPSVILTPTPTIFLAQPTFFEGPIVIGYSVKGRPLEVYRFGTGPVNRLIVAGIHGGYEANTIALADELIAHLQAHPDLIPHYVTLYILRNLNPDGLARALGVDGRANENRVDLNRNFPVNWQADWPRQGCWIYRRLNSGSGPASEPETQAVIAFASQVRPTAIISYHSAALGIFPGGEPADPASVRLAEALAAVSEYPYPPINTGCLYTGTLPDWAVSLGIASVDLELHTHKYTDFEENLKVLEAFLTWQK
jgi:protein MpaA